MKRLIFILFLFAVPCLGASNITQVTGCQASATSCTISSFLPGDLSVAFAYRSNSITHPTIATGYVTIDCANGANTNSSCTGFKWLNGNETTCGTWTNATQVICEVYRGADIRSVLGPIGGHTTTGSSSTTLNYNTITMTDSSGSSFVAGFGGCGTCANADAAPSGMTLRTGTSITNIAGSDTNGGVASWATTGVTITSSTWRSETVEILSAPSTASQSTFWQYVVHDQYFGCSNCGNASETAGNNFIFNLLGAIGTNNHPMIYLTLFYTTSVPSVTITCNSGASPGTWTLEQSQTDSTNTVYQAVYGVAGATAGCKQIKIVFGAGVPQVRIHYMELNQIATSTPVDTTAATLAASQASSNYMGAGTLTTTQANDLIFHACEAYFLPNNPTALFGASGENMLIAEDTETTLAGQYQDEAFIQTNSGAITPMFEVDTPQFGYDCIAVAYKTSNGAGTALPSGPQVISQYDLLQGTNTSHAKIVFPTTASGVVATDINVAAAHQWTSFTSANNTWTGSQGSNVNGTGDYAYNCLPTTGADYVTIAGQGNGGGVLGVLSFYAMAGTSNTSTTSCYDSTAGYQTNSGNANTTQAGASITPSQANGITFSIINEFTGPTVSVGAPTGAVMIWPTYTNQSDLSRMTSGNGNGVYIHSSAAAQSWSWTNGTGTDQWFTSAINILPTVPSNNPKVHVVQP